jgi:hypothetical protein
LKLAAALGATLQILFASALVSFWHDEVEHEKAWRG